MPNIGTVELRDLKDVFQTTKSYSINVYSYNGATNLTLAQLLLAVCLYRANSMEQQTVDLMSKMSDNTNKLNNISTQADTLASVEVASTYNYTTQVTVDGTSYTFWNFCVKYAGVSESDLPTGSNNCWNYDQRMTVYNLLKTKMDALNTISQEDMIDLQSLLNKRDQAYDLASNGSKVLMNSALSTANNVG